MNLLYNFQTKIILRAAFITITNASLVQVGSEFDKNIVSKAPVISPVGEPIISSDNLSQYDNCGEKSLDATNGKKKENDRITREELKWR